MNHDLIRGWLDLPAGTWPPDHYQLLGLRPRESDLALIEKHAQQRLDKVRCYQLAHPEQATEALNRLAQAYVCLTDPVAKRRYDEALFGNGRVALAEEPVPPLPLVNNDTPMPGQFRLNGRRRTPQPATPSPTRTPPPVPALPPVPSPDAPLSTEEIVVPGITPEEDEASTEEILDDAAIEATLPPLHVPEEPSADRICPLEEAARSQAAYVGLCTRGRLLVRIRLLRQLLRTWNNVGRLLPSKDRSRKPPSKAQTQALVRNLNRMRDLLTSFPAILGQAGQPAFLVLSLLDQEPTPRKLQSLSEAQRAKLHEDWEAGYALLRAHARLLTELTARFRGRGLFGRLLLALHTAMVHQPLVAGVLFTLVAGNLLLWGWYAYRWWYGLGLMP